MSKIKTPYYVLQPNGTRTDYVADLEREPSLPALKAVILPHLEGYDLERVNVFHDYLGAGVPTPVYTDMFVADRGAVDTFKLGEQALRKLRDNPAATKIYHNNMVVHDRDFDPTHAPQIYGPAVVFSRRVWW